MAELLPPVPFRIDDRLRGQVAVAVVQVAPVQIVAAGSALLELVRATCTDLHARFLGHEPRDIPGLQPARELYRRFGVDPTRTRPSSEALLRRILAGKPFPAVNNAVDACNLASVRMLLPLGLYDTAALRGEVVLRRGQAGESYAGIRKDDVHLDGRLTLADELGPFGNPTSDSARASVGEEARSLWVVVFAPGGFSPDTLGGHARDLADLLAAHVAAPEAPAESRWATIV
jgi:DNA/RNA-binding domain of Phe-tRNA-synthetase-like protein